MIGFCSIRPAAPARVSRVLDVGRQARILAVLSVAAIWAFAAPLRAELRVDITKGVPEPLPIAINNFYGAAPEIAKTGRDLAGVISGDLERSGLQANVVVSVNRRPVTSPGGG